MELLQTWRSQLEPACHSILSLMLKPAQEARKYHIGVQVLQPGQAPLGVVRVKGSSSSDAPRPDQVS